MEDLSPLHLTRMCSVSADQVVACAGTETSLQKFQSRFAFDAGVCFCPKPECWHIVLRNAQYSDRAWKCLSQTCFCCSSLSPTRFTCLTLPLAFAGVCGNAHRRVRLHAVHAPCPRSAGATSRHTNLTGPRRHGTPSAAFVGCFEPPYRIIRQRV